MCHDLNPTPYVQGQGYRVHILKSMSEPQLLTDQLDMVIFYTIVVHDQRVCPYFYVGSGPKVISPKVKLHTYPKPMSEPQILLAFFNLDYISDNCCPWKVKVTAQPYQKSLSGLEGWIWIFHSIFVHDQRVCDDIDPRSYLQGQFHSLHSQKSVSKRYLLTALLDLYISDNSCRWPKGVSRPWPDIISPRSRLQGTNTETHVRATTPYW